MRLDSVTDGSSHIGNDVGPSDHHMRPTMVEINNTTQSLPPGTEFNLDIAVGSSSFQFARCQLHGPHHMLPGGTTWYECAEVLATRDSDEAIAHSQRDNAFKKVYSATYSKVNGDSYLTSKIFDNNTGLSNRYIA